MSQLYPFEYIGNNDEVILNGFSLLQRGITHEGINVPIFLKKKKIHQKHECEWNQYTLDL